MNITIASADKSIGKLLGKVCHMLVLRSTPDLARFACVPGTLLVLAVAMDAAEDRPFTSMSLEDLMKIEVQTASLHPQSAGSAPANVTVITAEQIQKYGYRTFGEALNHVPGFYLTNDGTYGAVGIAGFSVPGDWATRTLVLLNGHSMTENIFGSANYFGEDFAVDMSLVDRIEIVRGPSSALYGSNGILATINVITRRPDREHGASVRVETGTLGERKITLTQAINLPRKASLLLSGSVSNNLGQHDIYIPEYDSPATGNGHAIDMDGSRGYHFFANLQSGNWQIMALAASREKTQPISWADTVFNDRGTRATDQRALVDALYTRETDSGRTLRWRMSYDNYRYRGVYHYPMENGEIDVNKEFDAGDWVGSQFSYRFPWLKGNMTVGTEAKFDLRALQSTADIQPVYMQNLYVNKLDKFVAGFLQQEWTLGRKWSFNLGGRYDWSFYRNSSMSPRASIVFQPDRRTSLKVLYGRGFRNPNANELFFDDGKQNAGNLNLQPERSDTFEVAVERGFHRSWKGTISAYHMLDRGIIVPGYTDSGLIQFQNADRFNGIGIGMELTGTVFSHLELSASFQKQKASFSAGETPANSPRNVGKLQAALPLFASRAVVSGGLLYMSERLSLAGATLPPVYLPEVTFSSKKLFAGIGFQAGVRNLTNSHNADPVGLTSSVDTLRQPGRTVYMALESDFGR